VAGGIQRTLALVRRGDEGYRTLVSDTFTRGDTTGPLGTADSGQAWATIAGTAFGITSNQAYNTDTANTLCIAAIDTGMADVRVACSVSRTTQVAGLVFRLSDASNYWYVSLSGSATALIKVVAGSPTTVATSATTYSGATTVEVVAVGGSIQVYTAGALLLSASDTFNAAAVQHGIMRQQTVNNSRHDTFSVRASLALAVPPLTRTAFLAAFKAIATDARFIWLPQATDTTTSIDASSNAATITHSQTVVGRLTTMGTRGVAVGFSAAPNKYADAPDLAGYSFGNGAADSACWWLALANVTDAAAARVLIAKMNDNGGGTGGEWYWQINASDKMVMALWDRSSNAAPMRTSDAAITQGVPKLFAAVYDGTSGATAANGITLYQDASVIASTATNAGTYVAMEDTTHTLEIGTFITHAASFMRGDIGLLAFGAGAMTAQNLSDIKALVNTYYGLSL